MWLLQKPGHMVALLLSKKHHDMTLLPDLQTNCEILSVVFLDLLTPKLVLQKNL